MATVILPDELAARVAPFSRWLPTILEISLLTFKTPAVEAAGELIEFLATNPLPRDVHAYHASERARERMERLLVLNQAGVLGQAEQRELDELIKFEHLIISLKAGLSADDLSAA